MNEQTDQCAICAQQPEDMLILSCSHNLCLPCATQLYAASSNPSVLQCEICLATTSLDADTVHCLGALTVPDSAPAPPELKIPKPPKSRKGAECSEHGQEALYFCFDCQNGSICSECILQAAHSGHSIMTIKKAGRLISDKIRDHSRESQQLRQKLMENSSRIQQFKASLTAEHQQRQANLKSLFESIIRQVTDRYNQLSALLSTRNRRSIQILEGTIDTLSRQMESLNRSIMQDREVVQKPQEQLLVRRYLQLSSKKEQIMSDIPESLNNLAQNVVLTNQTSCLAEIEDILAKINWNSQPHQELKQNQIGLLNSIQLEGSILGQSPAQYKACQPSVHIQIGDHSQREDASSANKYSGIKGSSRRLELSRSMNNATNIINRLQDRVRR